MQHDLNHRPYIGLPTADASSAANPKTVPSQEPLVTCPHMRFSLWMLTFLIAASLPIIPAIADGDIAAYVSQDASNPPLQVPYVAGTTEISPMGLVLQENQRKLKSGALVSGLQVVGVIEGSPAADAGLSAREEGPINALTGIAVVGAIVFPPAILAVPLVAILPVGRDGDLIIAVDSVRVSNFVTLQRALREARAGEIVYLTIVRAGARQQRQVHLPTN